MSKSFILPLQRLAHALLLLSLVSLVCIRKIHQHLVLCWLYTVIPGNPCKVYFIVKRLNPQGQLKGNSEVSSCWNALTMVHWLPSRWSSSPYFGLIWSLLCVFQILSQRGSRVSCLVEEFKLKEIWHDLPWILGYFRVTLCKSPCKVNMWLLFSSHSRPEAYSFAILVLLHYVQAHPCAQKVAGFRQHDPEPLWTDDGAGSCLTQLRSTQQPVKVDHCHTLLQSIPYSPPWQSVLVCTRAQTHLMHRRKTPVSWLRNIFF